MAEKFPHIEVVAVPQYLADQSDPDQHRHVFAYTITVTNTGGTPAQLIARHWIITDADGKVEEVRGLGVVGHQPLLQPGERFQYTSGCVLTTPIGSMRGSYRLVTETGEPFLADIPAFTLAAPRILH